MAKRTWMEQYKRLSGCSQVLLLAAMWVAVVVLTRSLRLGRDKGGVDGFTSSQDAAFVIKTTVDGIYDPFYASVYDQLLFNHLKSEYEVGELVKKTGIGSRSRILDVGSGTGHHVSQLMAAGAGDVEGVDISPAMVKRAQRSYPDIASRFREGDIRDAHAFPPNQFTHITCFYFTVSYLQDKAAFFRHCFRWLVPGGYLVLHLVDRDRFDPILPPSNPLLWLSPQRYAPKRLMHTQVDFGDFGYTADFSLDPGRDRAAFVETFKSKNGERARKQEHTLYMESADAIAAAAQREGFLLHSKLDLVHCQYEYQYLYVFTRKGT